MPRILLSFSTAAAALLAVPVFAGPTLYDQLLTANINWRRVDSAVKESLQVPSHLTEEALLKKHLTLVEETLRARDTSHLSPELRAARNRNLDYLRDYAAHEASPLNHVLPYRNPVFIDEAGRVCAVGYLMVRGGRADLANALSKLNNTIYIRQIHDARFDAWAASSGLSIDELAWIQPAYGPQDDQQWSPVGRGIAGDVEAVAFDSSGGLFAAGRFRLSGRASGLMRLAYFDGKRWYDMGRGVNGSVRVLAVSGGLLYAAGQFESAGLTKANNVAVFDPARKEWRALGEGLSGNVRTLAFYKGNLYAGGDFAGTGEAKYFARFNSVEQKWEQAGDLNGAVSSMQEFAGRLVLSGDFTRIDGVQANHVADFDGQAWRALGEGIAEGVSSMAVNSGELIFGRILVRPNPQADGEPAACSTSLNAWNGTKIREVPFIGNANCDPKHNEVAGIAGAGDTLVVALKNQGRLGFLTRYEGELTSYGGLVAETMTGLSRISVFAAGRGQLFFAGKHDPVRDNYRKYSDAGPGESMLRYFSVRSDFNRIQYSKVSEDSFYTPFSSLNGKRP